MQQSTYDARTFFPRSRFTEISLEEINCELLVIWNQKKYYSYYFNFTSQSSYNKITINIPILNDFMIGA